MNTPSWQEQRSKLNHDWLKNNYLVGLRALHARLGDEAFESIAYIRESFHEDFKQWPEKREEIKKLIVDFEDRMSPRVLFKEEPLQWCSRNVMEWLPDLVHELWMSRIGVNGLMQTAVKSFTGVETEYSASNEVMEKYISEQSDTARSDALRRIASLIVKCEDLSSAISKFPSRIEVV